MSDTSVNTVDIGGDKLMGCDRAKRNGYILSRILSLVLHPFLVPIYATIIILFLSSILNIITLKVKLYFIATIALYTLCLPLFSILLMRYLGVVKNLDFSTKRERILPLLIVVSCYIVCANYMPVSIVSFVINKFLFAAIGCIVTAFIINLFWKISLHMIAMGGLVAVLVYSSLYGYGIPLWVLILTIITTGALASARLYLGCHNSAQVAVGYTLGFIVSILIISL